MGGGMQTACLCPEAHTANSGDMQPFGEADAATLAHPLSHHVFSQVCALIQLEASVGGKSKAGNLPSGDPKPLAGYNALLPVYRYSIRHCQYTGSAEA